MADINDKKWQCIACLGLNEMKETYCHDCFTPKSKELIFDEKQGFYRDKDGVVFEGIVECICKPGDFCMICAFGGGKIVNEDFSTYEFESTVISDF
jgi:hypothetical protein